MRRTLKAISLAGVVVSASALASGHFGLAGARASTAPISQNAVRYVYGPNSSGMGYYQLAAPAAARAGTPTVAAPTRRASSGRSGGRVRDWTTGHSLPSGGLISKPWLRPR